MLGEISTWRVLRVVNYRLANFLAVIIFAAKLPAAYFSAAKLRRIILCHLFTPLQLPSPLHSIPPTLFHHFHLFTCHHHFFITCISSLVTTTISHLSLVHHFHLCTHHCHYHFTTLQRSLSLNSEAPFNY